MTPSHLTPEWRQITEADDPESLLETSQGPSRYIAWLKREQRRWAEAGKLAEVVCGEDGRCALYAKDGHGWRFYGGLD